MAKIIGGIGASHSPTIAFAKDTNKSSDPAWAPIFEGFGVVQEWVKEKQVDVLFLIFNDHVTSFFFDHYSAFALGVDDSYSTADEGGGPRDYPDAKGYPEFSRHIAQALAADEFDMSFFQKKPLDHGFFSPLSMIAQDDTGFSGRVIPLQVGVLQLPIPTAKRCFKLGKSLRKAIESFPEDLNVAVVATGGLSHQVHGERCGFLNEEWDEEFLALLEKSPETLANMRLAEYAEKSGYEGAEMIMWLIMRGALSDNIQRVHKASYAPSMTNIVTVIYEDHADQTSDKELKAYREYLNSELDGVEKLEGTYPFGLAESSKAYRLNDFLHRLVIPEHRERFVSDQAALLDEFELSEDEKSLVVGRKWIELLRYGVSFFLLEKMAAVIGISNPHIYAEFRGLSLEDFQKTRKVSMQYSVAGKEKLGAANKN
jgi:gallate dioxygenase